MSIKPMYAVEIAHNTFYKELHKVPRNRKYGKQITDDIR